MSRGGWALRGAVSLFVIALVGVAVGIVGHGGLDFWRLSDMVDRAEVEIHFDEHDPAALAVAFDDEDWPVTRVEVTKEGPGVPRGGRLFFRGTDEPVTVRLDDDEQEALLPNGARLVFRRASSEEVEATFYPADGAAPRTETMMVPEGELASARLPGLVGVAHADDAPTEVTATRVLTMRIAAERGRGFEDERGLVDARCRGAACTLMGSPAVTIGSDDDVLVAVQTRKSRAELPPPTEEDLEAMVERMDEVNQSTAAAVGGLLTIGGFVVTACAFWGPGIGICVGAAGTAAGVVGTGTTLLGGAALIGETLRQWFNAPTLDDPAVRRMAVTAYYLREATKTLRNPGYLELCTASPGVRRACEGRPLPDLRAHPIRGRIGGTTRLVFTRGRSAGRPPDVSPSAERPPDVSPSEERPPDVSPSGERTLKPFTLDMCPPSMTYEEGGSRRRRRNAVLLKHKSRRHAGRDYFVCSYGREADSKFADRWFHVWFSPPGGRERQSGDCAARRRKIPPRMTKSDRGATRSYKSTRRYLEVRSPHHESIVDGERFLIRVLFDAEKAGVGRACD